MEEVKLGTENELGSSEITRKEDIVCHALSSKIIMFKNTLKCVRSRVIQRKIN